MRGGDLLRFCRRLRDMTQDEVARQYGVDRKTYQKWENMKTGIKQDDLEGIIEGVLNLKYSKAIEIYEYVEYQTTAA